MFKNKSNDICFFCLLNFLFCMVCLKTQFALRTNALVRALFVVLLLNFKIGKLEIKSNSSVAHHLLANTTFSPFQIRKGIK